MSMQPPQKPGPLAQLAAAPLPVKLAALVAGVVVIWLLVTQVLPVLAAFAYIAMIYAIMILTPVFAIIGVVACIYWIVRALRK